MRDIVPLPPEELFDGDVIGLPITIGFVLRCVWNSAKPDTFPTTFELDIGDDPWFKWARESKANYTELWNMGMDILDEHTHRFGSRHAQPYKHGMTDTFERVSGVPDLPDGEQSPFPVSIEQAREAYCSESKVKMSAQSWATYTHRNQPEWLK